MNFIICSEKCRHQKDGYCTLEGAGEVTNALSSADCCYFRPISDKLSKPERGKNV